MNKNYITKSFPLIDLAIREDVGEVDITTNAIISADENCTAKLIAKSQGIIAGIDVAVNVFDKLQEGSVNWKVFFNDGDSVKAGDIIAELNGLLGIILTGERTALNFLQRLSGIATLTNQFVQKLQGTQAKLLDTRKTIPGFRYLDKYAVHIGGGTNHRYGLFDMIMIKENHIKASGSITEAVKLIKDQYGDKYKIEIETTNIEQVQEALDLDIDIIMLDNMKNDVMNLAVSLVKKNNKIKTEASGNVDLNNIKNIASTGVDFISVGAITHSVKALDISLIII